MARRERQFHCIYTYYQYNDGDGQCGMRERRMSFPTKAEALELARQIVDAVAKTLGREELYELERRTIPNQGYLTGARVERLLIDRVSIPVGPPRPKVEAEDDDA